MKPINEMSLSELELCLQNYIIVAEEKGLKWAEDKALRDDFENKAKDVLADLTPDGPGSEALKERLARKDPRWKEFREARSQANKNFLISQVFKDMSLIKIEGIRSIMSTRREEVKNFKG